MNIIVKEIEPCKLSVHYEADAVEILNKRSEVLGSFKKAPVPGFRQGKASIDAIKTHYKNQIEESLKRALAEDAYHNVLFEKKIKPHGAPRFNSLLMADGKFTCEFDLFTKPDFELSPYKNLDIPKPHQSTNTVEMTEKMLQELRVRYGDAIPYMENDFVQNGDNVILDYEGLVDEVRIDNLCAQGEMLTVGTSQLDYFDSNLIGMILGEVKEFDVVVPEGGLPSLAGKIVHFKVTLNMGSRSVPCPLSDELAHRIGKKDYNELREFIHATAGARLANNLKSAVNDMIANKLVDSNNFSVPNWMSLSEAQYLTHHAKLDWNNLVDVDKEKYLQMAERNVKLSLVLDRVREIEPEAQLSDQEVFNVIKQNIMNSKIETSLDEVIKEMNRTGYLQILFSRIRDEYTLDFIVKIANIIE